VLFEWIVAWPLFWVSSDIKLN